MMSISVCITGGSGFLGQAIVRELQSPQSPIRCSRIVVYDRYPPPVMQTLMLIIVCDFTPFHVQPVIVE